MKIQSQNSTFNLPVTDAQLTKLAKIEKRNSSIFYFVDGIKAACGVRVMGGSYHVVGIKNRERNFSLDTVLDNTNDVKNIVRNYFKEISTENDIENSSIMSEVRTKLENMLSEFKENYISSFVAFMVKHDGSEKNIEKHTKKATDNYNENFNILVKRANNLKPDFKITKIGSSNDKFTFELTDYVNIIHARFIFVNGEVNTPHLRFITTTKKFKA